MTQQQTATITATEFRGNDMTLAASLVGLLFIASPLLDTISSDAAAAVDIVAAYGSLIVLITRLNVAPRLIVWATVFLAAYALSAVFAPSIGDGFHDVLTASATLGAVLTFATYGKSMVAQRAFRRIAYLLIFAGVAAVLLSDRPKNITGGTFLYLIALFVILLISQYGARAWLLILGFFGTTVVVGFGMDFRAMIVYAAILAAAFFGSLLLNRRIYWFIGAVGSAAVIGTIIWYFLHVLSSPLAMRFTLFIAQKTGRPATSGRNFLWPAIVDAVDRGNPWAGLGAGVLPEDILPTDLSSHSTYIQTFLQLGYAGVIILVLLLLAVWKPLAFSRTTVGRFGGALFLMFVTHNATETIMFQNALGAAIPAWCAVGIALSYALEELRERKAAQLETEIAKAPSAARKLQRGRWR